MEDGIRKQIQSDGGIAFVGCAVMGLSLLLVATGLLGVLSPRAKRGR
jgi:hypothetical protein